MKDRLVGIRDVAYRVGTTAIAIRKRVQRGTMLPPPVTSQPPWLWRESEVDRVVTKIAPGNALDRARKSKAA